MVGSMEDKRHEDMSKLIKQADIQAHLTLTGLQIYLICFANPINSILSFQFMWVFIHSWKYDKSLIP